MMTIREYKRVESLEEAWELWNQKKRTGDRRYDLAEDELGQCRTAIDISGAGAGIR